MFIILQLKCKHFFCFVLLPQQLSDMQLVLLAITSLLIKLQPLIVK